MTGSKGTAEIATRYPISKGLIARTTSQTGNQMKLLPQGLNGLKTTIPQRDRIGID